MELDEGPIALDASTDDDVLGAYVTLLARLRRARPGAPIEYRTEDLFALSADLGLDPQHVEERIAR